MNKVILIGYVGNDPEIKTFDGGDKQATLSLATTTTWKDKETQEKKSKTQWHNIVVNGNGRVDTFEKWVHKGDRLMIEGSLSYRSYESKTQPEGLDKPLKVYLTEVKVQNFEFLSPNQNQDSKPHPNTQPQDKDLPF